MKDFYVCAVGTVKEYAAEQGVSIQTINQQIHRNFDPERHTALFHRKGQVLVAWKSGGTWLIAVYADD